MTEETRTLRDAVRLRTGMYLGGTDSFALYILTCNLLDHAVNEAVSGTCNRIEIVLQDVNSITVRDNGEGRVLENDQLSPNDVPSKIKWPTYKLQASIISLGLSVINAASSSFCISIKRNGFVWEQKFSEGLPLSTLEQIRDLNANEVTGTEIILTPDYTIFEPVEFDYRKLSRRLNELAYLIPGLRISLEDQRANHTNPYIEYFSETGLGDFVRHLNRDYQSLHDPIVIKETVELKRNYKPLGITGTFDIALQYADTHAPIVLTFVNGFEVEYGGPQIEGLIEALEDTIVRGAKDTELDKEFWHHGYTPDDCLCGLAAVLSIQHPKPETCNSLYFILSNPELKDALYDLVTNAIEKFEQTNPEQMQRIVAKCRQNKLLRLRRRYEI